MLNTRHELIQDIEPAISTFESPTHASFLHGLVAVDHHLWILLAQQFI
jgi:hypothetical protein